MSNFIKSFLKKILLQIPFVNTRVRYYLKLLYYNQYEPGHFYSTIPDIVEIEAKADVIFGDHKLAGIDLNAENQEKLMLEFKKNYSEYPYLLLNEQKAGYRYDRNNTYYRFSDAVFLYSMMRNFKPKRIIEVGSGYSSALMLDVNEHFFDNNVHLTFIEPYPEERLTNLLTDSDKSSNVVIENIVQNVSVDLFMDLQENDILFIDSTHVSKVGSDVNYLLFEVLPALKPGVLIHFHDIFYPFEMPRHWVLKYRWFWNENYILHAFLMNNKNFEIVAFNTFLQHKMPDWFSSEMPECLIDLKNTGSIWLRKL